jgi:hypothetical protein
MNKLRGTCLVLVGIVIGACAHAAAPVLAARAGGAHRCEYTYFTDSASPNIGVAGQIEYDEDWERVLSAGFQLKAVEGIAFFFERCQ